jgi:2'-5' RNA ligase
VSNLVIVAIPDENDRVWKVSSEQVPHMTLLFLGDVGQVNNLETIVQFVQHAATTTLSRFYLPVDKRGELGDDPELGPADVLFFKKGRYDYKAIRDFRAALLQENNIRTAYDSAQQFDGPWVPHLTLGYKNRPAKPEDNNDYPFYDVSFNKIAVWTDNYDGPSFDLKDFWDEYDALETVPMDVAMSAISRRPAVYDDPEMNHVANQGAAFLAHYGVKGMKWGVRKTTAEEGGKREGIQAFLDPQGHELHRDVTKAAIGVLVPVVAPLTWPAQIRLIRGGVRAGQARELHSQERKFAENAMSPRNFASIHNGAVKSINRDLEDIHKKYEGKDLTKDKKSRESYDSEVLSSMQQHYTSSANSIVNRGNTMHLDVEFKNDGRDFVIHAKQGPGTPMAQPTPKPKAKLKTVAHAATVPRDLATSAADLADEEITVEITGKLKRDANGFITGFDFDNLDSESAAAHTALGATLVTEILGVPIEHYGVKGMRWGVRRESSVTSESHADSGLVRRQAKVRTTGGEGHQPHEDAIQVARAQQKLKKSGVAALSNNELRNVRDRVQLEEQVKGLMTSRGRKFVRRSLETESQNLARSGAKRAAPHVIRKARKTAATGAVALAL